MTKRTNNPTRVFAMSFMLFVAVALIASEHIVSRAQDGQDATNANGSMQTNQAQNNNRGRGGRRATGRRNAPRAAANSNNMNTGDDTNMSGNMNADMTGDAAGMQDANMNANASTEGMGTNNNMDPSMNTNNNMDPSMAAPTMTAPAMSAPLRSGMAAPTQSGDTSADTSGEQTDLSGAYTGTINVPDANLSGEATLTITGNDFTLTTPAGTQNGRVTAVTTRGYTGVAMRFTDLTATGGTTPLSISARARRSGERLTLSKVPGGQDISFTPAGGGTGGTRRRGTRRRR